MNAEVLLQCKAWSRRSRRQGARQLRPQGLLEKEDIAKAIRAAMGSIENGKPELLGVLPQKGYDRFTRSEHNRHIREGLTEDELELFDPLKKDAMTQDETQRVKLAAKRLLKRLVEERPKVLVQDWFKDNQTLRQVRSEIERVLHEGLADSYERSLFKQKCDNLFDLVVDCASRGRKWAG